MSAEEIYPMELFDVEKELGFQVVDVENPKGHYAFEPASVPAVVLIIDDNNRIIKMNDPISGHYDYCHQRFGVAKALFNFDKNTKPKWNPTGRNHVIANTLASVVRKEIADGKDYNILTPDDISRFK